MKHFFLALGFLTLAACGGGYNPDKDNLKNAIELGESAYYDLGQGQGLMTQAPNSTSSGANFEVSFALQDQGSFRLYTFASNQLKGGLEILFERQGPTLKVAAKTTTTTQDWSSRFAHIDATEVITLTADIHNNEKPAHILIWEGAKDPSMNHRNAIYNSAEDSLDLGYDNGPGNGFGRHWGFQVHNAQLQKALLSSPQDSH